MRVADTRSIPKLRLEPIDLTELPNPFSKLRVLWLDSRELPFVDRVLVRLASVVGVPILVTNLTSKRRERLLKHLAADAGKHRLPHPREVFNATWHTEAERVVKQLGLAL